MTDAIRMAIANAQADELRRWRETVARLEAELAERRGEWIGLALAFSIILNIVLVAMLVR